MWEIQQGYYTSGGVKESCILSQLARSSKFKVPSKRLLPLEQSGSRNTSRCHEEKTPNEALPEHVRNTSPESYLLSWEASWCYLSRALLGSYTEKWGGGMENDQTTWNTWQCSPPAAAILGTGWGDLNIQTGCSFLRQVGSFAFYFLLMLGWGCRA